MNAIEEVKKKEKQKTKYSASMGQFHLPVKYVNY